MNSIQNENLSSLLEQSKTLIAELSNVVVELKPKAEAYDDYISRDNLKSMKDISGMVVGTVDENGKAISRNDILKMLVDSGDIQKTYNGYKCYAKGREHGLVERQTYDVKGNEHYSVLATHLGVDYIYKMIKKVFKVVA